MVTYFFKLKYFQASNFKYLKKIVSFWILVPKKLKVPEKNHAQAKLSRRYWKIFRLINLFDMSICCINIPPENIKNCHCVKTFQIRSHFWSVFSRIRTEYGERRSTKYLSIFSLWTPYLDTFHAVCKGRNGLISEKLEVKPESHEVILYSKRKIDLIFISLLSFPKNNW